MRSLVAWALAALMLGGAVWIVRSTGPGSEPDAPVAVAALPTPQPKPEPAARVAAAPVAAAPSGAKAKELASGPPAGPTLAGLHPPIREEGGSEPGREPPGTGRPPMQGGVSFAPPGSDAVAVEAVGPGPAPTRAPPPQAEPEGAAGPPEEDVDPPDVGACLDSLALWSDAEKQRLVDQWVERHPGVDEDTAWSEVLALLAVGVDLAEKQLGADAPRAQVKARADQIFLLAPTLTNDQLHQKMLAAVANC